jgi:hypothetical protein
MSGIVVKNVYLVVLSCIPWCYVHQGDATMLLHNKDNLSRSSSMKIITAGLACLLLSFALNNMSTILPSLAFVKGMLGGLSIPMNIAGLVFYGRWRRSRESSSL